MSPLPPPAPADPRAIDPDTRAGAVEGRAVRRSFGRAAATYDAAAVLQREVARRMAARLDVVKLAPTALLDAGCGTGEALGALGARYPAATRVALDLALPMLEAARVRDAPPESRLARLAGRLRRRDAPRPPGYVCADIASLPFAAGSFELVWSNLALQWVNDLPRALAEFRRVLRVGGLVSFTTLGPDTLKEIRAAFAGVDRHTHVSRFVDMHDVGDLLAQAGFADPVMDMEHVTLTYADAPAMLRDLRAIGATNATLGRPRGLMGRGRYARAQAALEAARIDGRIPATFEVIYGHAWKAAPTKTDQGLPIVKLERGVRR
jgi:malonyl-CoA O-methyltransferase